MWFCNILLCHICSGGGKMPDWKQEIRSRLANTRLEPTSEADIVDELAQHLEDRYQALRSAGADERSAYAAVINELGESELLSHEIDVKTEPVPSSRKFFTD